MLRLSIRNLLVSKLRLFLTVAAVTVGVSFVSGTFVLSDTMGKAFDELYVGLTTGTDVVVKSEAAFEASIATNGGQVRPLDESMVDEVRAVPGVALARGARDRLRSHPGQERRADPARRRPDLRRQRRRHASLRRLRLPAGPQPTRADQVAIDARTAEQAGFQLGDRVDVVLQDGRQTFTLVGTIGFGENDSLLGATMAGFDLTTAQRLFDKVGLVDEVDVQAEPGVSAGELRDRIAAVLPDDVEALTGDQVAADGSAAVRDAMGAFTTVLLAFAVISLLVGSFVIWNTFNVLVAQRRREVALLRAVGATRRQVLGGVLVEATLVGTLSGGLGLLLGVALAAGIRSLLKLIGVEMPTTSPAIEMRTVAAALLVGILVTVVAAIAPAWAATRVAPMEALRDAVPTHRAAGRRRSIAGAVLVATGTAALAACIVVGDQRWWTVIATMVTFAGLVVAGPTLARATARLANHGRPGGGWRMAARNIERDSRRAAATALALTIGLTVVVAVAVSAASLRVSVADAVSGGNRSDLILEPAGAGLGVSPSVADLLRDRVDVTDVVELRETGARVDGHDSVVSAMNAEGLDRVIDLGIEAGSLDAFGPGTILVSTEQAERLGVGDGRQLSQ